MIIDKVTIYLRSGKGGEGSSAIKKLSASKAMASGGDGGKGGDVILKVSPHPYDLSKFKGNKKFIAPDGERGKSGNKRGRDGADLIIDLPLGTQVLEYDHLVIDLVKPDFEFLICKGGAAGKGNHRRDYPVPAGEGKERELIFDYRVPNDVAILGLANSGKTALFNALTGQERKVAEYAFTTTSCFWANSDYGFKRWVVLDTPPFKKNKDPLNLVENRFLRHIFRSKILLLLSDSQTPEQDFKQIEKEISLVDKSLLENKKIFYLLSKVDTIDRKKPKGQFLEVSVNKPETIEALKVRLAEELEA